MNFFLQKKLNQESQPNRKNKYCRFECEIENYSSMEHVLAKLDMKTVKLSGFQVISPADQSTKGLEVFFLQTFFAGNSQSKSCGGQNAFSHQVCNIIENCYTLFKITIKLSMQH